MANLTFFQAQRICIRSSCFFASCFYLCSAVITIIFYVMHYLIHTTPFGIKDILLDIKNIILGLNNLYGYIIIVILLFLLLLIERYILSKAIYHLYPDFQVRSQQKKQLPLTLVALFYLNRIILYCLFKNFTPYCIPLILVVSYTLIEPLYLQSFLKYSQK